MVSQQMPLEPPKIFHNHLGGISGWLPGNIDRATAPFPATTVPRARAFGSGGASEWATEYTHWQPEDNGDQFLWGLTIFLWRTQKNGKRVPLNHSGCQIQELGTGKPEVIPRQNSLLVSTELLRAVGRLLWKDAMKLHRSRPHLVSALAQQKSCNAAAPKAAEAEMPPLRTRTASDLGGTEMRPGRAPNLGHAGAQVSNAGATLRWQHIHFAFQPQTTSLLAAAKTRSSI